MNWATYVHNTAGRNVRQREIAAKTDIDQTTISRWQRGERRSITMETVRKFATGYDRPILEAFVAAGFLTDAEAKVRVIRPRVLDHFTIDELLAELARRTTEQADQGKSS